MTREEALSVLGVSPQATRAEIQTAHRELAQMLHPDKFGDNRRLRARAEAQMKRVNEARDTLLKHTAESCGARSRRAGATRAVDIRFEAEARSRAAEAARLMVVAQLRTMTERRRAMVSMAAAALVVSLLMSRMRGTVGALVMSVASMLVVWGIVDVVSLSSQIEALRRRSMELLRQRDRAQAIADEAARL